MRSSNSVWESPLQERRACAMAVVLLFVAIAFAANPGVFENWGSIPSVGGPYEHLFQPQNDGKEGEFLQSEEFRSGFSQLQQMVKQAKDDGRRIRAYGSKWSSTNIAYTNEYLVESWGLNYAQVGIDDPSHIESQYQAVSDQLVFAQSGVMIRYLNQALLDANLALSTTGSSDGQRVVGSTTANAHGAAFLFGPMTKWVRGIHVVLPDKHVFIQPSSDPVVTDAFVQWLGVEGSTPGELVSDDDMFNAAVVGLGSFGIVHGLVIQAEPLYELRCQSYQRSYPEMRDALTTLDFSSLNLEGFDLDTPYHFVTILNPYKLAAKQDGAFIDYCEKIKLAAEVAISNKPPSPRSASMSTSSADELPTLVMGGLETRIPKGIFRLGTKLKRLVIGASLQIGLKTSFSPFDAPVNQFPSEWFTFDGSDAPSSDGPRSVTLEIGVPLARTLDAIEILRATLYANPISTSLEIRPVKSIDATLAFTRFDGVTTTIALSSGLISKDTLPAFEDIYKAMAESGIPYTYHWGKGLPSNEQWIPESFGSALSDWQAQRNLLLDSVLLRDIFANKWMEDLGLYEPL